MVAKSTKISKAKVEKTAKESTERVRLASLGAFSLLQKRGGEWIDFLVEEGKELPATALKFVDEATVSLREKASGAIAPLSEHFEKRAIVYAQTSEKIVESLLARLGVPTKSDLADLSKRIDALSRKIKVK